MVATETQDLDTAPYLRYEIKNTEPIELTDLTTSMLALGDEYKSFLEKHPGHGRPDELRLYVREIRSGSVIADLVALVPFAPPFVEHANSVVKFGYHLKNAYAYLTTKSKERPTSLDKRDLKNLARIVNPIVKDSGAQLNIAANEGATVHVNFNLTSLDANVAQNVARRDIAALKEPLSRVREKVVMWLYQARHDFSSSAGDRAIIESISKRPIKVEFVSDDVKRRILYREDPFRRAYVVDVEIETLQGQPVLYKVVHYHGTLSEYTGQGDLPELPES